MKRLFIGVALLAGTLPTSAQQDATWCAQGAPLMRAMAIDARKLLDSAHQMLPEGIESDVRLGTFDEQKLRATAAANAPSNNEMLEAAISTAYLIPVLQNSTERYEIAASALEACAK